ncbi:hypothetical protein A6R68_09595, partial [Neotoma lepida]
YDQILDILLFRHLKMRRQTSVIFKEVGLMSSPCIPLPKTNSDNIVKIQGTFAELDHNQKRKPKNRSPQVHCPQQLTLVQVLPVQSLSENSPNNISLLTNLPETNQPILSIFSINSLASRRQASVKKNNATKISFAKKQHLLHLECPRLPSPLILFKTCLS